MSALFILGCAKPQGAVVVNVPDEIVPTDKAEPAEQTPPPNDILAVPQTEPAQTPAQPVSTAQPLPRSQYADPAPPPQPRVHVVQPKETLYGIARRYYGEGKQWRRIFQANNNRITDPNRIEIGMKLIIP
jgi:nucleoid-associated protein YgaU